MSRRSESIRLKVMPDGHIRAYKYDKGGAGERNVIYGGGVPQPSPWRTFRNSTR